MPPRKHICYYKVTALGGDNRIERTCPGCGKKQWAHVPPELPYDLSVYADVPWFDGPLT